MPRGSQFLSLITDLRSELNRSTDVNVGVDDLPVLKRKLNRKYFELYMENDWPHLRHTFPRQTLSAGQQYYNLPANLNVERIEDAHIWYNEQPLPFIRGISVQDYATFDSAADERSEPALRWDIRWTGSSEQIEVWPLPVSNDQEMQFTGIYDAPKLVNDSDVCLLDDNLVVLFAASELAKKEDKASLVKEAGSLLRRLKARGKGGSTPVRMGLGDTAGGRSSHAVVRIGG